MFKTNEIIFFKRCVSLLNLLRSNLNFEFYFNGTVCAPLPCQVTCIEVDDDLNKYVVINEWYIAVIYCWWLGGIFSISVMHQYRSSMQKNSDLIIGNCETCRQYMTRFFSPTTRNTQQHPDVLCLWACWFIQSDAKVLAMSLL